MSAALRGITEAIDRLALGCAYLSGALYVITAIFLTMDITGRRIFSLSTGMADELSGYALLAGGTFALAYTLRRGQFVRIDVLLPYMPKAVQTVLNFAALLLMASFALLLGVYSWRLALESYEMGARAPTFGATPLVIPQALMALGFCMLALQSLSMLLSRTQWQAQDHVAPKASEGETA